MPGKITSRLLRLPPRDAGATETGRTARLVTLMGVLILLAAGIGMAYYADRLSEEQRFARLSAQARILAATTTAALDFGDRTAALEYLDALRTDSEIVAAAIYDQAGARFATYPQEDVSTLPATGSAGDAGGTSRYLIRVEAPITLGNAVLGTVVLQASAESELRRLQRYGPIALLVAMAAMLVGVLGYAHVALRRANAALADRADALARANRGLEEQIAHREKAEAALRQAQKMEAIGQLTGGVAHDFNNLLQIVLGSLERVRLQASRDNFQLPERLDRMIEAAMQGGRRAATLTQRLLAFSRQQPLAPKPIELNRLVAGMSDLLARTLGEGISIETVFAAGLWRTQADENQLENALLNLAVNARDAMPGGGKLTIETRNAFLDETYSRNEDDVTPGQYVELAVTDTGTGMSPEVAAKVFEPFFTTKGVGHGTGLGLSQVYGFIKQSGGHVKIYSEVGDGTTVKLYLPRLAADSGESRKAAAPEMAPLGDAGERILVVEDEDGVRSLAVELLRDLGYTVQEASAGAAALKVLSQDASIRLLFTDVGLPGGMNGRQLADAARAVRPDLKVLFTTGYARNAIVHHGRLDPGVQLISKPYTPIDLAQRIRSLLDGKA